MRRGIFFIPVFLVLCTSLIFAKTKKQDEDTVKDDYPLWITDSGRKEAFPSTLYISALGYGFSAEEARQKSAVVISEYIKSSVSSSSGTKYFSSQLGNSSDEYTEVEETSSIVSDNTVYLMEYTNPFFDEKTETYICVAYINRNNAFNYIEPKLKNSSIRFANEYSNALKKEDPFEKIILITQSQKNLKEFYEVYDFARAVNRARSLQYEKTEELFIQSESILAELKPLVSVEISVDGDLRNQVKNTVSKILSEKGIKVVSAGAEYSLYAAVSAEITQAEKVFVCYPAISVTVSKNGNSVCNYENSLKKTAGFDKNSTERKAMLNLCKDLEENFLN